MLICRQLSHTKRTEPGVAHTLPETSFSGGSSSRDVEQLRGLLGVTALAVQRRDPDARARRGPHDRIQRGGREQRIAQLDRIDVIGSSLGVDDQ